MMDRNIMEIIFLLREIWPWDFSSQNTSPLGEIADSVSPCRGRCKHKIGQKLRNINCLNVQNWERCTVFVKLSFMSTRVHQPFTVDMLMSTPKWMHNWSCSIRVVDDCAHCLVFGSANAHIPRKSKFSQNNWRSMQETGMENGEVWLDLPDT